MMSSLLIKKIAQKIAVDYCSISIVENPDGFLTQDIVRNLLYQECAIKVIAGSNLQLRIHYELNQSKEATGQTILISNSSCPLLADMKRNAYCCRFIISELFPMFADKSLVRKQPYEVLEVLYERAGTRRVSMPECTSLILSIVQELEDRKRMSAEFFKEQLTNIEIDWNNQSSTISTVSRILAKSIKADVYDGLTTAIDDVNAKFQKWIDEEYFATLRSNPLLKPKSVNNILPFLVDNYSKDDKVALLVIDGFTYWQYTILKDYLATKDFKIKDDCTLAWLPSITMLSRQAIFRGSDPLQDYKQNPENEKKLWFEFWKQHGFGTYEIQYLYDNQEFAINEGVKRLAVVTVEMDEKMHSSTDYKDLCSLTENWCPRISKQIETIVNAGYKLYLTTDHGCVLSHGWRALSQVEKVFLYKDGSRGARHLIYNNGDEQDRFYNQNTDLPMLMHNNWISIRDNHCFAKEFTTIITHGGSHFLEVVIPFIKIEK